jgi:hypothetical protein
MALFFYIRIMRNLILFASIILTTNLSAQYNQSIGFRGGGRGMGLTYNYYLGPKPFIQFDALGVVSEVMQGGIIVASYNLRQEIHSSTLSTTRLNWSYGGGLHAGYYRDPTNVTSQSDFVIGPDVRLATEFQFKLPIVIGVDVMGYYNILPALKANHIKGWIDNNFDFGVYLKYVID